jgi:hypothetical protein
MSIHSSHRAISILAGSNGVVKSPTHSNMGFSAPRYALLSQLSMMINIRYSHACVLLIS